MRSNLPALQKRMHNEFAFQSVLLIKMVAEQTIPFYNPEIKKYINQHTIFKKAIHQKKIKN